MQESDWLEIGRIVGAQGLQGEVRVYPSSDFPQRFEQPGTRWIVEPGAAEPEPIELLSGRYLDNKGLYVIKLRGVTNRDRAEALRNSVLMVPAGDRLPLEEGEFHVGDLVGLQVYHQTTQALVGTVTEVLAAGNDLLEVELAETDPPRKALIPFVEAIVPVVDLEQNRIEILPPAGLLD
jgi:16S rRNA processing protein RimM